MNTLLMKFESEEVLNGYPKEFFGNDKHEEAGLDLYVPEDIVVPAGAKGFKIDLKVKCALCPDQIHPFYAGEPYGRIITAPYMLMCRSSIIKTPLRQSNAVGLIDAGYRGSIQFPVDNLDEWKDITVEKGTRLCQLVAFDGKPIMALAASDLPESKRGEGGFGSTGA